MCANLLKTGTFTVVLSSISVVSCVYLGLVLEVVLSTFVAVFVMHPVQVVDGVHRVELDLGEVFVADPVELRGGMGGRRPRHVAGVLTVA